MNTNSDFSNSSSAILTWPFLNWLIYFLSVGFIISTARSFVELTTQRNGIWRTFWMEFLACTYVCMLAYENAVILRNYTPIAFFFVTFWIPIALKSIVPGGIVSPFEVLDLLLQREIEKQKAFVLCAGQFLSCIFTYAFVKTFWYYSIWFVEHEELYYNLPCSFDYKIPFLYVPVFEFFASFCIHFTIKRLPKRLIGLSAPFVVSFFLWAEVSYIGVVGINPVVVTARMFGCPGLSRWMFFLTYWLCPTLGRLAGMWFDRRPAIRRVVSTPVVDAAPSTSQRRNKKKVKRH